MKEEDMQEEDRMLGRTYSRVNSPPCSQQRSQHHRNIRVLELSGELTANTLSSEVLPAFCNPIIVISISVALSIKVHTSAPVHQIQQRASNRLAADDGTTSTNARTAAETHQNNLNSQSYTFLNRLAMVDRFQHGRSFDQQNDPFAEVQQVAQGCLRLWSVERGFESEAADAKCGRSR